MKGFFYGVLVSFHHIAFQSRSSHNAIAITHPVSRIKNDDFCANTTLIIEIRLVLLKSSE